MVDPEALMHAIVDGTLTSDLLERHIAEGSTANDHINGMPLASWAIAAGNVDALSLLFERGAEVKTEMLLQAANGCAPAIPLLVAKGIPIDVQDPQGQTALMRAAISCDGWSVRTLLDLGADPTKRRHDGKTASDIVEPLEIKAMLDAARTSG